MAIRDYISERHHYQANRGLLTPDHKRGPELTNAAARIKVVGVGTGGCNTVQRLMDQSVPCLDYTLVNTDRIAMESSANVDVIQIGADSARVWNPSADNQTGDDFGDGSAGRLKESVAGADLVIITAGMGGGTGTGAAPYVAHLARQQGALVVAMVTAPFGFEGRRRMGLAVAGVDQLRPCVDNLVLIHNDRLLGLVERNAQMAQAFQAADEVVGQGILAVSESLNQPQEMNVNFNEMSAVMGRRGGALMAVGRGSGNGGPVEAARQAVSNPLLDRSFEMSTGALLMIKGGAGALTMNGVHSARHVIANTLSKEANICVGVRVDESMGESVRLTVIATGLQRDRETSPTAKRHHS